MDIIIYIVVPVLLAAFGWMFGYITSLKVNMKARKKELITKYLIQAYTDLCDECHRGRVSTKIETALSQIQLFGTEKQIEMTQLAIERLAKSKSADIDSLLFELRNSLRYELGIEKTSIPIGFIRVGK